MFTGTSQSSINTVVAAAVSTTQYTKTGLNSGATYYVGVSAITSNENYTNSDKATASTKTSSYVVGSTSLSRLTASYNTAPASASTQYPSGVACSAHTAMTIVRFDGITTSSWTETQNVSSSINYGISGNVEDCTINASNGAVSVPSRQDVTGYSRTVGKVYAIYNGMTSSNAVTVSQSSNTRTGYTDYSEPYGGSFSATTVPASGGTSTPRLYNSSSVRQTRKSVYTSGYIGDPEEFRPTTITSGKTNDSDFVIPSKGTVTSDTTTTYGGVWYAANDVTAQTTVAISQSANTITGYTCSISSPSSSPTINPWETTITVTPSGRATYSSKDGRDMTIDEFTFT